MSLELGEAKVFANLIRTSVDDKYSGSMKITTHLRHISHCKTYSCMHWSNRWDLPSTYYKFSPRLNLRKIIDDFLLGSRNEVINMSKINWLCGWQARGGLPLLLEGSREWLRVRPSTLHSNP